MASGEIVNVNSDHNQDLFFALKGGSNNFGVVTRFDLKTFPQGKFWGGVIINPVTTLHSQLEAFHELSIAPDYNVYSAVVNNFYYNSATDTMYAVNFIEYTKAEEYPASLKSFTDIEPVLQSTMRVSNLSDFTIEQANYAPNGQRCAPIPYPSYDLLPLFNSSINNASCSQLNVRNNYIQTFSLLPPRSLYSLQHLPPSPSTHSQEPWLLPHLPSHPHRHNFQIRTDRWQRHGSGPI